MTFEENKALGIKSMTTATGRVVGPAPVAGTGFFRVAHVDGKPGTVPDKYSGKYTSQLYAEMAARNYVTETWEVAEETLSKKQKAS